MLHVRYLLHLLYMLHMRYCGDAVMRYSSTLPGVRAREVLAWAINPRTYPPSVVPGYAPSVVLGYGGGARVEHQTGSSKGIRRSSPRASAGP